MNCLGFFFFFKQKTAYEMCGRDWSSDVCSSDLAGQESRTDDRGYAIEQHSRDCEVQLFDIVRHSEVARVSKAAIFVVKSDGLCHDDEWGEHT